MAHVCHLRITLVCLLLQFCIDVNVQWLRVSLVTVAMDTSNFCNAGRTPSRFGSCIDCFVLFFEDSSLFVASQERLFQLRYAVACHGFKVWMVGCPIFDELFATACASE